MKKLIGFCCILLWLAGCASKAAHPIIMNQSSDQNKSCRALAFELYEIDGAINKRKIEIDALKKRHKNLARIYNDKNCVKSNPKKTEPSAK